jgi:hypothetical protein
MRYCGTGTGTGNTIFYCSLFRSILCLLCNWIDTIGILLVLVVFIPVLWPVRSYGPLFYMLCTEAKKIRLTRLVGIPDPVFGSATLGARPAPVRARIRTPVGADRIRNIPLPTLIF